MAIDPFSAGDDLEPAPVPKEIGHAIRGVRQGEARRTSRPRAIEECSVTVRAPVQLVESLRAAIARIEAAGGPATITFKSTVVAALEQARDHAAALADAVEQKAREDHELALTKSGKKMLRAMEKALAEKAGSAE